MRNIALILLSVTLISAFDLSKFSVLVQTGTRDNDAVQSVYALLEDLKTENANLQAAADRKNATDEEISLRVVGELTQIVNINQQNYNDAKAYRDGVDSSILETYNFINWANNRLVEIVRRSEELSDQRCYANQLFVKALKDHTDALEVVKLLKSDLSGFMTNSPSEFAQVSVTNVAARLSMYSHLFQQDAIKSFMSLANQDDDGSERKRGDTIPEQVYNVLLDLEEELNRNLADLQTQEIKAAFALARWLSDSEAEKAHLDSEIVKNEAKLEKLNVIQPAALQAQAKVNQILKDSILAVQGAIEDLQEKRDYYEEENNRRAEENAIVDTVLAIFKDQVQGLVSGTSLNRK